MLIAIVSSLIAQAQQTAVIGTGTTLPANTLYSPLYRFSATSTTTAAKSNILFTQDELNAVGIVAGSTISSIEFYKGNAANFVTPASKFNVYVANSTNTSLATTTTWASILASHTLVFQSTSYNVPNTIGWVQISFSSPFTYTGGSLEIATDVTMVGNGGTNGAFQWQYTTGVATDRIIGVASTGTTLNGTTAAYKFRPNIRFTYNAPSCIAPPTAGTATASNSIVCPGETINLNLIGNSAGANQTYQWESSSTETGVYSPIGSSSTNSSASFVPSANTWYRAAVTCSGQTAYSTPVFVKVNTTLAGSYTINKSLPTSGRNFNSFNDALQSLRCGITSAVVFNIDANNGIYDEQLELQKIPGASSVNTITFKGNNATLRFLGTTTSNRAIVKFNGAEWVIIDSLNILGRTGSSTSEFAWGVHFIDSASNNILRNSKITVSDSTSSTNYFGVIFTGSNTSSATTDVYKNNTIENNTIYGGNMGILIYAGSTNTATNNKFINNKIVNFYGDGINIYGTDSTLVEGNDIYRENAVTAGATEGIYLRGSAELVKVSKNKIHNISGGLSGITSAFYGIDITSSDAAIGRENIIINNLIYNIDNAGTQYGIYNSSSNGMHAYFNTIVLDNQLPVTTLAYGVYQTTLATNIILKNNLISVSRAGTGNKIALAFNTNTSTIESDNNILFVSGTGTNYYIGSWGAIGTAANLASTIADWKLKGDSTFDNNSFDTNPYFFNVQDNNYTPTSAILNNKGVVISGITTDVNNQVRSSTNPDIGAIEFNPPPADIGISEVFAPKMPFTPGNQNIVVVARNYGGVNLTSFNVNYTVNGVAGTPYVYSGNLAQQDTDRINIGSFNFVAGNNYLIKAWASNPNGSTDPNAFNDTSIYNITSCFPIAGNLTVNNNQAVSNTNFHTINDALTRLRNCGVSGAVTINVDPSVGVLNERILIDSISGVSATNTLTLIGNGVVVTDTILSNDLFSRYLLNINKAKYVTIKGFEFLIDAESSQGFNININNSSNIQIKNNRIINEIVSTSTTYGGIVLNASVNSTTSTSGNNTNILIDSNYVYGGYYAISVYGSSSNTNSTKKINITNNTLSDFYAYGVNMFGTDSNTISKNNISRETNLGTTTLYGIYVAGNSQEILVEKNRIHNLSKASKSSTSSTYGIYFTTGTTNPSRSNKIINNLLYKNDNQGANYGIYTATSANVVSYFNTVVFDELSTSTGAVYGFYFSGTAIGNELRNNNVYVTKTTSGSKYGIYVATTANTINSDYNNIYVPTGNFGYYSGANRATLSAWTTVAPTNDLNSFTLNPFISTITNANYTPSNIALEDKGTAIINVFDDINGLSRNPIPDIGAIEFAVYNDDAGIVGISNGVICSGNNQLAVQLKNFGASQLTTATINWSVNGVNQTAVNFIGAIDNSNEQSVSLGNYNFIAGQSYSIKVWSSVPNSSVDLNATNDTLKIQSIRTGVSGNFTVGGTGANFSTIKSALDSIKMWGVCGPVNLILNANVVYTEQVLIERINNLSAVNILTIKGNNAVIKPVITNTDSRAIIKLKDIKYVVLDSLNLQFDAASTYTYGIHFMPNTHNITIKNSSVNSSTTSTSSTSFAGIVFSGSNSTILNNNFNSFKNNIIENNTIIGGYYSIALYGNANDISLVKGNTFINNNIRDFYSYGISIYSADSTTIYGNNIQRPNRTSVSAAYNIYIGAGSKGLKVFNNKISNTFGAALTSTSAFYGIYFTASSATQDKESIVANNLIYNIKSNGAQYGMFVSTSDSIQFYHNTIVFDHTSSATTVINGLLQSGATVCKNIIFKNNLISITRPGAANRVGIYLTASNSTLISDYNNIYVNGQGSTNLIGNVSSTTYPSLISWNNSGYDVNSYTLNPAFTTATPGVLLPSSGALDNRGTYLNFVSKDLRDSVRNINTPDIGAFEFTGIAQDAGLTAINFRGQCAGNTDVTISVLNASPSVLDEVIIDWKVNGIVQIPDTLTNLNIASSQSGILNLGSYNFDATSKYNFEFIVKKPNGQNDGNNLNDTLRIAEFRSALSGTYTIGGVSSDFVSIKSFAENLNLGGVCGPVVANINAAAGPYTDRVVFTEILGASATNTIKINGKNSIITDTISSSTNRALVYLNGTDYMTIDSLNIILDDNSSVGYALVLNNANNNIIKNNKINALFETSTSFAGIVVSGSEASISTSSNSSFNTITNNEISGGYYGISLYGTSGNKSASKGNIISNNIVKDFYGYGIYVQQADSTFVTANDISRPNITQSTTTYGINIGGLSQNVEVSSNKVHDLFKLIPTSTSTVYGIYSATGAAQTGFQNVYINNLVYDITNNGSNHGIYNSGAGNSIYLHNTVVLRGNNTLGIANGFYQTSNVTGIELYNNIFYVDKAGAGVKVGIYMNTAATPLVSDYNNIYVPNGHIGYNTTNRTTLSNWRAVASNDTNSISINPVFSYAINNNFSPTLAQVNNLGTNKGVSTDITGKVRSVATPDMGAYEFDPITNDLTVVEVLHPNTNNCGLPTDSIVVVVRNQGINSQTGFNIKADVTGSINTTMNLLYSSTLTSGNSDTITLKNYNTNVNGIANIRVYTELANDVFKLNDTLKFNVNFTEAAASPIVSNASVCKGEEAILVATTTLPVVKWYDQNGVLLATNDTLITPAINANTKFYAEALAQTSASRKVGAVSNSIGSGGATTLTTYQQIFNTTQTITIDTVYVYASANGTVVVNIKDNAGAIVHTVSRVITTSGIIQKIAIAVNATLAAGSYRMDAVGTTMSLYRNTTGASYPYSTPGNELTITGNSFNNAAYYYFFYDWKVSYITLGCPSARVEASVNTLPTLANVEYKKSATSEAIHNTGNVVNPDALCVNNTIEYYISNPTGYDSSQYATTWLVENVSLRNVVSNTIKTAGLVVNGRNISYTSSLNDVDSVYVLSANIRDLSNILCDTIVERYFTVSAKTAFSLGNDTSICEGNSITLTSASGLSYLWSNGATTQSIQVNTSGKYYVDVTNNAGCISTDTINVNVLTNPVKALGDDKVACATEIVVLDAGNVGSTYLWSTGATTQTINVISSGTYIVRVTNAAGCSSNDTVNVLFNALPIVNLGADASICVGSTITLDAGNIGSTYLWSTGATTQTIEVSAAGTYSVVVTNTNGCDANDEIVVSTKATPVASYTSQALNGLSVQFNATASAGQSYLWDFGDPSSPTNSSALSNPIHEFTQAGTYNVKLTVTNVASGCVVTETKSIVVSFVGISNTTSDNLNFFAAPNPYAGSTQLNFSLESTSMVKITMYDVLGRKLKDIQELTELSAGQHKVELDNKDAQLPSGIYLVKLNVNGKETVIRVRDMTN